MIALRAGQLKALLRSNAAHSLSVKKKVLRMNKYIFIIGLMFLSQLLSGCSAIPPYQEAGFGGGYKEKGISNGVYELYYGGNGFATLDGVRAAWHRRAGDLCMGGKYKHEFTFDGKKSYGNTFYTGGAFVPISFNFPEIIGIVACEESAAK